MTSGAITRRSLILSRIPDQLHARLVYPLIINVRGEGAVYSALAELRATEQLSNAARRQHADRRLAVMLRYARQRCRYYAEQLPAELPTEGEEVRSVLAALPPLRKHDLRRHAGDLRASPSPRRVTRKITGGSTGETVTVFKDRAALAREMAASWLGYGWFGINIGDRSARFWGSPHTLVRRLRFAAADFAMHRIRFSAFAFDEHDLDRYWTKCVSFRPRYLYGYASMLEEFARFVDRRSYNGRGLALKAIVSTSEVLSETQRTLISTVFGAPVQNEYGCGEVGPIAYECPDGGLHIMSDNLVVELLRDDGSQAAEGEAGEVVVTDLNNRAMPLLRYALGDYGIVGKPCVCGRTFPTLERIWGRAYDFVQTPAGRRYHGEFFMYYFEDLRADGIDVRKFKIVQDRPDHIRIEVVLPPESDAATDRRIASRLAERLPEMGMSVHRVPAIERLPSGKTQVILNAVHQ